MTKLGDFLKFWVKILVSKIAQMYCYFWAILKTSFFSKKIALATFWEAFGNIWATFTLASGHTARSPTRGAKSAKSFCQILTKKKGDSSDVALRCEGNLIRNCVRRWQVVDVMLNKAL